MSTNTQVKSTNKLLMLLVALVLAVACFAGGGALIFASATENGDGETATGAITVTGVTSDIPSQTKDIPAEGDVIKVWFQFSESAATEAVSDLQDLDAYKNKVLVNGVPFETLTKDSELSSMSFVLKNDVYQLYLVIERKLLSWIDQNNGDLVNVLLPNQIIIKAGFPLMEEGNTASASKVLVADEYFYNSVFKTKSSKQEFVKAYRGYYDNAAEAKITKVSLDQVYDTDRYRLVILIESGEEETFFEENVVNLLQRQASKINVNKGDIYNVDGVSNDAATFFANTGILYSIASQITLNGITLADWKRLPLEAAIEAGFTTENQLGEVSKNFGDFNKYVNAYIQDGNKIIYEFYKPTSKEITYTDENGEKQTMTLTWDTPDLSGDLEVKLLPGFTGKDIKCSEGSIATYDSEKGLWTYDNVQPSELEEIKITEIGAPVPKDGPWENCWINISFDKQQADLTYASIDPVIYFKTIDDGKTSEANTEARNKLLHLSSYNVFDRARNNIIIGGVFGESDTFRTLSLAEMMSVNGWDITGNGTAVLHILPDNTRINIAGAKTEEANEFYPFHVSNFKQNFTLTIKAGLRIPGVADANGVYPIYETKRDYNYIYDYGEGKWYEGTELADIYKAQAQVVVDAISKLPEVSEVKLSDKATVEAARELYDFMYYSESEEYVTNYQKLVDLEAKIAQLEAGSGNPDPGDNNGDNNGDDNNGDNNNQEGKKKCGSDIGGAASVSIAFLMLGMAAVVLTFKRGKKAE